MDLYRFTPAFAKQYDYFVKRVGTGPFYVVRLDGFGSADMKSVQDGRIHTCWSAPPAHWGVLDPFMAAAYSAIEQHEETQKDAT